MIPELFHRKILNNAREFGETIALVSGKLADVIENNVSRRTRQRAKVSRLRIFERAPLSSRAVFATIMECGRAKFCFASWRTAFITPSSGWRARCWARHKRASIGKCREAKVARFSKHLKAQSALFYNLRFLATLLPVFAAATFDRLR